MVDEITRSECPIKTLLIHWVEAEGMILHSVKEETVKVNFVTRAGGVSIPSNTREICTYLVFRFQDGSTAILLPQIVGDYGGAYGDEPDGLVSRNMWHSDDAKAAVYFGLVDPEVYAKQQQEKAADYEAKEKEKRRAYYLQLKKEFEP